MWCEIFWLILSWLLWLIIYQIFDIHYHIIKVQEKQIELLSSFSWGMTDIRKNVEIISKQLQIDNIEITK